MRTRHAVVLFNLGGPDSLEAVRPFLYNLFADPDILQIPFGGLLQKPLAWLIARRRAPEAAHGYAAIGGRSPLLEHTRAQAAALKQALGGDTETANAPSLARGPRLGPIADVFIAMRYWHPFTDEVVAELKRGGYTRVLLLPLYPHYSRTTTGSSMNAFNQACRALNYQPCVQLVRAWFDQPDYVAGIVETLKAEAAKFPNPDPGAIEVLFSAHGLPKKLVEAGDPYEQHIHATFEAARAQLGFPHTSLCYQSRVGPLEWLRPYTDDVIREMAARGVKQILVYPIAFVSDHVETLFELGMTYAQLARSLGVEQYRVTPALNSHPRLIAALKTLALEGLKQV